MSEPQTYVALKVCGCLAIAIVNSPQRPRDVAREIAKGIRQGYTFQLRETASVREMQWTCDEHCKTEEYDQGRLIIKEQQ